MEAFHRPLTPGFADRRRDRGEIGSEPPRKALELGQRAGFGPADPRFEGGRASIVHEGAEAVRQRVGFPDLRILQGDEEGPCRLGRPVRHPLETAPRQLARRKAGGRRPGDEAVLELVSMVANPPPHGPHPTPIAFLLEEAPQGLSVMGPG